MTMDGRRRQSSRLGGGYQLTDETPVYVISVAAQLSGLHPQTLRQYDRLGLVSPDRTAGRGRRYSARDIELLRTVQALSQDEGINLAGIKRIIELENQVAALQQRVAELSAAVDGAAATLQARRPRCTPRTGATWSRTSPRSRAAPWSSGAPAPSAPWTDPGPRAPEHEKAPPGSFRTGLRVGACAMRTRPHAQDPGASAGGSCPRRIVGRKPQSPTGRQAPQYKNSSCQSPPPSDSIVSVAF